MTNTKTDEVFDLSGAVDDLFDFERELTSLAEVKVPNAANHMGDAFEAAGTRIERALTRAAKSGELDFEHLVTTILNDLARIAANAVISQVFPNASAGGQGFGAPFAINLTLPEGGSPRDIAAAEGQIAAALTAAAQSGGRWS